MNDSQRLKILITDPHLKGGGQVRYITNLVAQLHQRGHQVHIGCRPGSVLADVAHTIGCGLVDHFDFRGGLRPAAWKRDWSALRRLCREEEPDIVHVNASQDHWAAALVNRFMRKPPCLLRTRHNTNMVSDNQVHRLLNHRWTDYQIVVCEEVRQRLVQQRAFEIGRTCSIHNGVDAQRFKPDSETRAALRGTLGYGPDDLVAGIVARLVPAKGHELLFRAVAALKGQFPELRLLVLGQGTLDEQLHRLATELDLEGRVQFMGFKEDIHRWIQAVDIGVQPSVDCDTSSFSLKEQMAAEKAVIASDYGGLKEIVSDGVEGLVVRHGAVQPLVVALKRLASDDRLRLGMGKAGRRRVLRDFTVEVFADKTLVAYRRALQFHQQR